MKNIFVLTGYEDGTILDAFAFADQDKAFNKMKSIYEDRLDAADKEDYIEPETYLDDDCFQIAFYRGYMNMEIQEIPVH